MDHTAEEVWNRCLKIIRDNVNLQSFKTWFEPIKPISLDDNILTIQVPSLFFYEWLEEHYVTLLHKTIQKEIGPEAQLEYDILVENTSQNPKKNQSGSTIHMPGQGHKKAGKGEEMEVSMPGEIGTTIKNPFVIPGLQKVKVDSQLNDGFVFNNFIEGECNRLARSAGLAVAEKPGKTSFNPLLVYGGVGLGKTHLAQAIGNQVQKENSDLVVLYVSAEKFTNQFIEAIKKSEINDFISFYQLIDVLIIDDVQFFEEKGKTQDVFFHIFNHLHQKGKQLVLTSDRPPAKLKNFEERLVSRFKWGLSADLQVPEFETRMAILENKMHVDGIKLPDEVVEYVAYNITTTIRELEGALISLLAHASLDKQNVDLPMARKILASFINKTNREKSVEQIRSMVCEHLEVDEEKVKSKERKRPVVQARQLSMYFANQFTNESLARIGYKFGGRDHSTVIYACRTVQNLMETDQKYRQIVEELNKKLKVNLGD